MDIRKGGRKLLKVEELLRNRQVLRLVMVILRRKGKGRRDWPREGGQICSKSQVVDRS